MLKGNGASLENKNDGVSPYLSWFVKDTQELKRGGTAPINQGRIKKFNIVADPSNKPTNDAQGIENKDNEKDMSPITTSFGPSRIQNHSRGGSNTNNETHKITRVLNSAGVNTYRLTKKPTPSTENNRLLSGNQDNLGQGLDIAEGSYQKSDIRNSLPSQQDEVQSDLATIMMGSINTGNSQNGPIGRPQTAYYKGNGAFRRGRILNESSQNYEEFPTPNTGNLELESLNNLNNKSSERNKSPKAQKEHKGKVSSEINNFQEGKDGLNIKQVRQSYQFEKEIQKGPVKAEEIKPASLYAQDNQNNDVKFARVKTTETKNIKAKQVLEGRRYAEDTYAYDLGAADEPFIFEYGGANQKGYERNETKQNERVSERPKESLVAMIGRSCQDNVTQKRTVEDEDFNESPGKLIFDDTDQLAFQKHQVQRPPARKNGQAMFLDSGIQNTDKKPLMMSPIKGQAATTMRPPSRHKLPNKALGLDLPDAPKGKALEGTQGYEKDPSLQKRETVGRTVKAPKNDDADFQFGDDDFENLDFDHVFDVSDFMEEEDDLEGFGKQRPKTNAGNRRNVQTSQSLRPQGSANKHALLQSAKGRGNDGGYNFNNMNPLLNNKLDQPEKIKTLKSQKERRLESAYNPSKQKAKGQARPKNDVDACDIYNVDAESDDNSQNVIPQRKTNVPNTLNKGNSGMKLTDPEKVTANNFLNSKPLAFKDKKSQIVFIYNKESHSKKENIDLPFETTLEKDFVGLFAN